MSKPELEFCEKCGKALELHISGLLVKTISDETGGLRPGKYDVWRCPLRDNSDSPHTEFWVRQEAA